MVTESEELLNALIEALRVHYEAVSSEPTDIELAEQQLRDAFFNYDDSLFTEFDSELPFDIIDDEYDDDDDDEDTFDDDSDEDEAEDINDEDDDVVVVDVD